MFITVCGKRLFGAFKGIKRLIFYKKSIKIMRGRTFKQKFHKERQTDNRHKKEFEMKSRKTFEELFNNLNHATLKGRLFCYVLKRCFQT